jgi:L-iditol 2-dehydrogenase
MTVAVMSDIGKIEYVEKNIPVPSVDEVLVKVEYVGICGSDLHYFSKGAIGDYVVRTPFVLGHEAGGTVIEVGRNVKNLKAGDRVAMEPGKTCGKCEFCQRGKYNLCPDVVFFATPPVGGVFQEYVAHEADLCFRLPDNVSTMEGALIEPLAVGFHAANQSNAQIGNTAVVMGAGCIGLASLLALIAKGISKVYVVDIVSKRLEKAVDLGAAGTIDANKENVLDSIMNLTEGMGCDIIIETTGNEAMMQTAIKTAKKGAIIVFVGYSTDENVSIPINAALDKELTFKTIFRYRHIYPMAIEAVSSGAVNIKDVVTNIFDFKDLQNALDQSIKNKKHVVKAVVKM